MILNKYSYCHKRIRFLCAWLENTMNMKLQTNLDEEFNQLFFNNELQYLRLDWDGSTKVYTTLNYKVNNDEKAVIEEILVYLDWLDTGEKIRLLQRGKRRKVV